MESFITSSNDIPDINNLDGEITISQTNDHTKITYGVGDRVTIGQTYKAPPQVYGNIPLLLVTKDSIDQLEIKRGKTSKITLSSGKTFCINTVDMILTANGKSIKPLQRQGVVSQRGQQTGPAAIWLGSSRQEEIKLNLSLRDGAFYAVCSEDCIVLGVQKEHFSRE